MNLMRFEEEANQQFKEKCAEYEKFALEQSEVWFQTAEQEMKFATSYNGPNEPDTKKATVALHKSQSHASLIVAFKYKTLAHFAAYVVEFIENA